MRALPGEAEAIAAISAARELVRCASSESLENAPLAIDGAQFRSFLLTELQSFREERLCTVYLDRSRQFLCAETRTAGSRSALEVSVRAIIHRALDLQAYSMIIAHNHPSGDCRPSAHDVASTNMLCQTARALEIDVEDHFIVASNKIFSIRQGKLL